MLIVALGVVVGIGVLTTVAVRLRARRSASFTGRAALEGSDPDTDPTVALRAYSKRVRNLVSVGIAMVAIAISVYVLSYVLYDKHPEAVPSLVLLFIGAVLLVVGLFAIAVGAAELSRVGPMEHTVAGYEWVRVPCRYQEVPDGIVIRALLVLKPDTSSCPAVLSVSSIWRRAQAGIRGATLIDYAGNPS